jgi:hypothetical protein
MAPVAASHPVCSPLHASATAAAESLCPPGWRVVVKKKKNGQWSALCTKGTLYCVGTSKNKPYAIASACLKAWKKKTGKL